MSERLVCPMCRGSTFQLNDSGSYAGTYIHEQPDGTLVRKQCDSCGGTGMVRYEHGHMISEPPADVLPSLAAALIALQQYGQAVTLWPSEGGRVDRPIPPYLRKLEPGVTIGRRTVVDKPEFNGKYWMVKVRCECGRADRITADSLLRGMANQCKECKSRRGGNTSGRNRREKEK